MGNNYERERRKYMKYLLKQSQDNVSPADVYNIQAIDKMKQKDYKGAIEEFSKVIKLNHNDEVAYYNRGCAKRNLNDYNGAIADHSKAIELNPGFIDAYINRGNEKSHLKDYAGAVLDLMKAIELNPNIADAYTSLAIIKSANKDFKGAFTFFGKAIEVDPNNAIAYFNRGNLKSELDDVSGAVKDFNQAININEKFTEAYVNRGMAKIMLGDVNYGCIDLKNAFSLGFDKEIIKVYVNNNLEPKVLKEVIIKIPELNDKIVSNEEKNSISTENNNYSIISIGAQELMFSNLNVDHYRNGDIIPQVHDAVKWSKLTSGAWCYYNNNVINEKPYGKLYNWYAVNDKRGLAPDGWHIPSDEEWSILSDFLGGRDIAGGKLKATILWKSPNLGAIDECGFSAYPGGFRSNIGVFSNIGEYCFFWSSSDTIFNSAWYRAMYFDYSGLDRGNGYMVSGLSVRCVKD